MKVLMKKEKLLTIFALSVLIISVASCNKTNEFEELERQQISEYLDKSSVAFEKKPSGLYYSQVVAGNGIVPVKYDTAYVRYTGKLLDGTIFDSNITSSAPLAVLIGSPSVIQGFMEGITYMASGGKSLFLIPSSLGYGSVGNYYGGISGYTPLLFEVQLVLVKPDKDHK